MDVRCSLVVSAFNEEANIGACLDSVSGLADEIIVVDNSSTDKTAAIAKAHGAKVFKRENLPMLNTNKNFGFTKATGPWILCLDADEEVTPELKDELKAILSQDQSLSKKGYWISRKNIIFGKWIQHGLWWPDRQLRFFRKESGSYPCRHVHEYIAVEGETGECQHPYVHHNYDSITQYLRKLERYTTTEAAALRETNYQLSWFDAIRFPLSDFLKTFFAQSGYRDGLHGLTLSILQAFYSFIVFAKLWEAQEFPQKPVTLQAIEAELNKSGREMRYWMLTARIKETKGFWSRFLLKIRRRMTL